MKDENTIYKAQVNEADKSRELIMREMSSIREVEGDKVRQAESKKEAEVKMMQKLIESLKRDKKELEERIEDIIAKQDIINSRHTEEHHNTVKYFENIVA